MTSQEPDPSFFLTPSADVAAPQLFAAAQLDPDQALRLLADHTREVVCLQDVIGRISWISPAVQSQLGFPPQALVGRSLEELIDPADHPAWRGLMADAAAAGPASTSLRMLSAEGESRWVALTLRPAEPDDPAAALVSRWHDIGAEVELRRQLEQALGTDPLSGLASWSVLIAQLEERVARPGSEAVPPALLSIGIDRLSQVNDALTHQARSALAESALAITEAIPVGTYTMVLPPDGGMASFSFMSERFLEITGLEREAAAADPFNAFACIHPDDHDAWVRRNAEVFAAKLPFYGEARIVVRGEERWISAESVPRDLSDGSTVWEGVLIDITDRIRAQEELGREKARLATTLESLLDPHLTLQPLRSTEGRVVDFVIREANAAACADLGLPCEQLVGALLQERLPAHAEAGLLERYRAVLNTGEPLALNDFCLVDGQGKDHPILDIRVVRVGDGLSCTWRDGRERYEAARQLAESEERYRLLAENSSDVVMQLGNDGTIRWVSPSLTAMLGWQPAEWIGRPGTDFLEHRGDTETYRANMEALQAGRSVVARDRVRARSGTWHWVETHACSFRTASGAIDGLVAFFRTIDAEVEAEEALARQASTDALTGLPNRRETFRQLEELTRIGEAQRPPLALAFCDLDWFKRVNDSHGHGAGDALLVAVGERLRTALRPDDLVGRIGGDELLVVLMGVADLEEALQRAEALRTAVRQPLAIVNASLDVTASIGVTLFQPGESVDALVARADAAMYRAKQAGRDRVIPISA